MPSRLEEHLPRRDERALLVVAILIVAALHLVGLGRAHVLEPDEGRYADVAKGFLDAASRGAAALLVPRTNGVPFLDKPPLVCWAGAVSMKLLGETAFALRLVPALAGVLAALVAGAFAHVLYRRGAWAAVLLYGCAPLALGVGRTFTLDVPLTALTSLGALLVLGGAGALDLRGSAPQSPGDLIKSNHLISAGGGLLLGLATLVKGPVALGLAGLAVLTAFASAPSRRLLSPLPWLVALAVSAPWYVLVARAEPELARAFFWEENFLRFAGPPTEHIHGFLFFPASLLWGLGGASLAGLVLLGTRPPLPRGAGVLAAWSGLVVLFFSLSSTKVETYILPVFPALAGVIGGELETAVAERSGPVWRGLVASFVVFGGALAVACAGFLAFVLGAIPLSALPASLDWAPDIRAASSAWLAALPLAGVACAFVLARTRSPRGALLALGATSLLVLAAGLGPLERLSWLRSSEPAAELIREARGRSPGARVASFRFYYRGLPFFLGEPVVLLGDRSELKAEAFAERPDLFMPDMVFWDGVLGFNEDCWTRAFVASTPPLLVVMPSGKRTEWFEEMCGRAGVKAVLLGQRGEDSLYEVVK